MSDVDSNGVDWLDRFHAYSERFKQSSVAGEVYLDTLEHIKRVRKERDEAMALIETIANEVNVLATRPAKIIKLHDIVYLINEWGNAARKILDKKENDND